MSEAITKSHRFFDLFMAGQASAADADDFVTAWHESGADEQRPLIEYLGMTDEEYGLWVMDHRLLPVFADARRQGGDALVLLIKDHVARMRRDDNPIERAAVYSLTHWLKARGIDA